MLAQLECLAQWCDYPANGSMCGLEQHHDSALKMSNSGITGSKILLPFIHVTEHIISNVSHSPCSLCCATTLSAKPTGLEIIRKQRGSYCRKIAFCVLM
jgi:hypothetical protein